MILLRLAANHLRGHKVRTGLTIAAISLALSLVVAATSGFSSLQAAAMQFFTRYLGSADAQVRATGDDPTAVPASLLDAIRADPQVDRAAPRLELDGSLLDRSGRPFLGPPAQLIGIQRPQDTLVESQSLTDGQWFDGSDPHAAVIDQAAAGLLDLSVGDPFTIPSTDRRLTLRVSGIVHKPDILAQTLLTIYLPIDTLQEFALDRQPRATRILIDLKPNADIDAFVARWEPRISEAGPNLQLRLARESRKQIERNLMGLRVSSYLAGGVSLLAAGFIVFTTLSMGITERSRVLAMLRAVGMHRRQVAHMILVEALMLGIVGIGIGIPLGAAWIHLLAQKFEHLFSAGVVLSARGILLGSAATLIATVVASLLPAWAASRVDPLQAMRPLANASSSRAIPRCVVAGLLLVSIDPLLMFAPFPDHALFRAIRFYGHFAVGLPGVLLGFFLLSPLLVLAVEKLLGRPVALLLGVRYPLLRQQLGHALWRSAGTGSALMVGLAVLVVMQIQGHSSLNGWRLPTRFPDIFIFSPLRPLTWDEQPRLEQVPGILPGQVMPIAIASPELGSSVFAIAGAAMLPDATMFLGVDPDKAMQMMELDFRAGNPADAAAALKKGRHLIVTEEFRNRKGLTVGDTLPLKTARHGVVNYTVAAVVWSPGLDVIVGMHDLGRQFERRTVSSVFGSLEDAREDFGATGAFLWAANLRPFTEKEQVLEQVRQELGVLGLRAGDVRQIKAAITDGLRQLLLLSSTIAFSAMAVASLGVVNTILASLRTRQWQLGILRSIGLTGGQLLRLIAAEAILLGLIGCALGLAAGMEMALNARGFSALVVGYVPPLFIPWKILTIGIAAVLLLSLLAGIGPAIHIARQRPLTLLSAGRAAA